MRRYEEHRVALTPGEKLRAAHAVLAWGWEDHRVAQLLNVSPERVSEAVTTIRNALGDDMTAGVSMLERRMLRDVGLRAVEDALKEEPDAG